MKITYVTNISGVDGGSIQGLNYCEELNKRSDVELSVITNKINPVVVSDKLKETLLKPINYTGDAIIVNGFPWCWKRYFAERFNKFCGYCVLEGEKIPQEWVNTINEDAVDYVFVPSTATKEAYIKSGVKKEKIAIIPHGIDPDIFKIKTSTKKIPNSEGKFKFLSVGGWGKPFNDRKGSDILIKAFAEEFKSNENVMLVLKINKAYNPNLDIKQLIKNMNLPEDRALIYLIEDNMYAEEISELYNSCDCYVSPTKGEAFGMTILEALACGLPCIVTENENAGYIDFCKSNVDFIKQNGYAEIPKEEFLYSGGWINPDKEDLKRLMRKAFDEKKGKNPSVSESVRKEFSWANAVNKIIKILEE